MFPITVFRPSLQPPKLLIGLFFYLVTVNKLYSATVIHYVWSRCSSYEEQVLSLLLVIEWYFLLLVLCTILITYMGIVCTLHSAIKSCVHSHTFLFSLIAMDSHHLFKCKGTFVGHAVSSCSAVDQQCILHIEIGPSFLGICVYELFTIDAFTALIIIFITV